MDPGRDKDPATNVGLPIQFCEVEAPVIMPRSAPSSWWRTLRVRTSPRRLTSRFVYAFVIDGSKARLHAEHQLDEQGRVRSLPGDVRRGRAPRKDDPWGPLQDRLLVATLILGIPQRYFFVATTFRLGRRSIRELESFVVTRTESRELFAVSGQVWFPVFAPTGQATNLPRSEGVWVIPVVDLEKGTLDLADKYAAAVKTHQALTLPGKDPSGTKTLTRLLRRELGLRLRSAARTDDQVHDKLAVKSGYLKKCVDDFEAEVKKALEGREREARRLCSYLASPYCALLKAWADEGGNEGAAAFLSVQAAAHAYLDDSVIGSTFLRKPAPATADALSDYVFPSLTSTVDEQKRFDVARLAGTPVLLLTSKYLPWMVGERLAQVRSTYEAVLEEAVADLNAILEVPLVTLERVHLTTRLEKNPLLVLRTIEQRSFGRIGAVGEAVKELNEAVHMRLATDLATAQGRLGGKWPKRFGQLADTLGTLLEGVNNLWRLALFMNKDKAAWNDALDACGAGAGLIRGFGLDAALERTTSFQKLAEAEAVAARARAAVPGHDLAKVARETEQLAHVVKAEVNLLRMATRLAVLAGLAADIAALLSDASSAYDDDIAALASSLVSNGASLTAGVLQLMGLSTPPLALILAVIQGSAAVIYLVCRDDRAANFAEHSIFGEQHGQGSGAPKFSRWPYKEWTDDLEGLTRQLVTLNDLMTELTIQGATEGTLDIRLRYHDPRASLEIFYADDLMTGRLHIKIEMGTGKVQLLESHELVPKIVIQPPRASFGPPRTIRSVRLVFREGPERIKLERASCRVFLSQLYQIDGHSMLAVIPNKAIEVSGHLATQLGPPDARIRRELVAQPDDSVPPEPGLLYVLRNERTVNGTLLSSLDR